MPERNENMIAALKRERAGYVARGLEERVAEVDEQLAHYGYEGVQDPPADPDGAPKGRTTRPRRTATSGGGRKQAAAKTPEPAKTPETPADPPKDPAKEGEDK